MTFISEDAKLAVKRGARFMDENFPGWAESIDLSILEMANCQKCIIGQAAMDIGYFGVIESAAGESGIMDSDWAIENGFDASSRGIDVSLWYTEDGNDLSPAARARYFELETLWTEEVAKRLG